MAYYVLFATMGGAQSLPAELIAATIFTVIAIIGFRTSLWWVASSHRIQHTITWTPRASRGTVPAGIYFVRLEADGAVANKRLVILP